MKLNDELNKAFELSDDDLDVVVGGGKGGNPFGNGGTDTESIKMVANQNIASGVLETMTVAVVDGVTGVTGVAEIRTAGALEQEEVNNVNFY